MAFVLLPVASRILGDASFGRYNLATTIMFFVMLIDDFGINMWLTREIAKNRDCAQRYFAFSLGLKSVLIFASLLFVAILLALTGYDAETVKAIWIFSLYGVLISFRDLAVAIYRAAEEMVWESLVLTIERVLVTVFGIVALLVWHSLIALSWAFVAAAVISLLFSSRVLFSRYLVPQIWFSWHEFGQIFKGASLFGISVFLTTFYSRIDMMMLSVMKPPQVWGYYGAAHKLIDFTNVVPTVLMIAMFPAFSRLQAGAADDLSYLFTRGVKMLLLLAVPLIPGVMIFSQQIVDVVYGSSFQPAVPALRIFGVTAAILFINIFAAGLFGATGFQRHLLLIQMVGLLLNAGLNTLLIPGLAHIGAAAATVITEGLVLIITLWFALTRITRLAELRFLRQILLATAGMTGVALALKAAGIELWLGIGAGFAVYVVLALILRIVSWREIVAFRQSPG